MITLGALQSQYDAMLDDDIDYDDARADEIYDEIQLEWSAADLLEILRGQAYALAKDALMGKAIDMAREEALKAREEYEEERRLWRDED